MKLNKIKSILSICILLLINFGCNNKTEYARTLDRKYTIIPIQEFKFKNKQLEKIIVDYINKNIDYFGTQPEEKIVVLNLAKSLSTTKFTLSIENTRDFSCSIFGSNCRLIGFAELSDRTINIIELSEPILSKSEMELVFFKYLYPTNKVKTYDYIYFPFNLYEVDKKLNPKTEIPTLTDYSYDTYKIENDSIIFVEHYN